VSHQLGHFIHYGDDPGLKEVVVLKPDWLSKAVSFVLEDQETKDKHGLVTHKRLGLLWNNPARPAAERYDPENHPIFLSLMERFEIAYRVDDPAYDHQAGTGASLIAQLVAGDRPADSWPEAICAGEIDRVQVCEGGR